MPARGDLGRHAVVLEVRAAGLLLVLLVALGHAPPAGVAAATAIRDDINLGGLTASELGTFNPLFGIGQLTPLLFTRDTVYDERWRLVPQGVEYIPSFKDGTWRIDGDAMTLVWRLKPRRWRDGRLVTCSDYVFTFNVLRNPQIPEPAGRFDVVSKLLTNVSCDRPDGLTVTARWSGRYLGAVRGIVGGFVIPRHAAERFYRGNPSGFDKAPYGTDPRVTIGDGPYRLVDWRRGELAVLEAVVNHSIFGTPRIRRIVRRIYRTRTDMVNAMVAGTLDGMPVFPAMAAELKRRAPDRFQFVNPADLFFEHIDFNLDNAVLRDVRVRRAIVHALNRAEVWRSTMEGFSTPFRVAHGYLPPLHPGYAADVPTYPYDPDRARRLLREAGYTLGPDGILVNAVGDRLSLELITREDVPPRRAAIQVTQRQLRQVGIDVSILTFPPRVFFDDMLHRRKFKAMALYAWVFYPEDDCDGLYTSDGIPTQQNGWTGQNYPGYRNPEMDRLCKEASREMDWDKRARLLRQTGRIFARDLPAVPLVFPSPQIDAVRVGLENFKPNVLNDFPTWNAYEWYWK